MKWIEIINLRSAGAPREFIEQKIPRSVAEADPGRNPVAIQVYRHATVDTDLGVHLLFEAPERGAGPSALGECLASELKAFGLVSHSVWTAQEETGQSK